MRNLFLALLLANLGFAAWSAWIASEEPAGRPADDGLLPLTLVSEVPADLRSSGSVTEPAESAPLQAPAEPSDTPIIDRAASAATAAARCTSVGPFRELSQTATAAATLRSAGYQPLQRVAEGDVWIGYWVYIPAIATEREANEVLAKVRADGIADSYVIPNSDSGNLVSTWRVQRDQRRESPARSSARARLRAASRRPDTPRDRVLDRHRARPFANARLRCAADSGPNHPPRAARLRARAGLAPSLRRPGRRPRTRFSGDAVNPSL